MAPCSLSPWVQSPVHSSNVFPIQNLVWAHNLDQITHHVLTVERVDHASTTDSLKHEKLEAIRAIYCLNILCPREANFRVFRAIYSFCPRETNFRFFRPPTTSGYRQWPPAHSPHGFRALYTLPMFFQFKISSGLIIWTR